MATNMKVVQLFGGAITARLPADFGDVSDIRQVPDNQEVYLSTSGFASVTVDLCERVTTATSDAAALDFHLADIIADGDGIRVYAPDSNIALPNFLGISILSCLAKVTPSPPEEGRPPRANAPTYLVILLALVRLETQMTDMVITFNMPNIPGSQELVAEGEDTDFENGKYGRAVEEGRGVMAEILKSLEVKDWGLFGPGG